MINIIGLGYIGLPTALMFASKGIEVVGTDLNVNLIEILKKDKLPFQEKGMEKLFQDAKKNNIKFSSEYIKCDMYLIAVPTPYIENDKKIDISYLVSAIKKILKICMKECTIIIESTISPGTIDNKILPLIKKMNIHDKEIHLVHAPERIIPGNMIYELQNNSRTIGSDNLAIGNIVANIYKKITIGKVTVTDIITAEMSKVIENTFRAVNIAFANELAIICNSDGVDVNKVIEICNQHPRVNILSPGPGVGGHCIPVDPWFLVGDNPNLTHLIKTALEINDTMHIYILERIKEILFSKKINKIEKVGIYGLTYKENVDDYRLSPALKLIKYIKEKFGIYLNSFDPKINKRIIENQEDNFQTFLRKNKLIVVMVKHDHIKKNINAFKDKIIFDTQNCIKSKNVIKL